VEHRFVLTILDGWVYNWLHQRAVDINKGFSLKTRRVKAERTDLMDDPDPTQLHIEISVSDATEEELDRMTRQLLSELRETDIESAELAKGGPAPMGSKGDPIAIGSIVLEMLPDVMPVVIGLVHAWSTRGQGRTVKFKGKGFEFEGSPEEFQKLLATLEKGKKKK
jgi:hypothetical protein